MPRSLSRRLFMSLSAGTAAWSAARPAAAQGTQRRMGSGVGLKQLLPLPACGNVPIIGRTIRMVQASMPKCQVIDPAFTWGGEQPPALPWHETILYELHVRGYTLRRGEIPEHADALTH